MKPNDARKALEQKRAALADAKQKRLQAATNTKPVYKTKGTLPEKTKSILFKWGVKSMEELLEVNTADKKFGFMPKDEREMVKSLKEAVDLAVISSKLFKKPVEETKAWNEITVFVLKAFGINSGDQGFEWIPTMVSDSYLDEYNLPPKVAGLFTEVKMPSNPYKWPVLSAGAVARVVGEVTALATAQTFKTDKSITLDAKKFTNQYALPEELNEDSAVDMIRTIRQELIEGQEKSLEIAILEGDTAGTLHYYSQLPDVAGGTLISALTDTPEKAFDGIRKRLVGAGALAIVDAGGNAVTEAELSTARKKMGKFGVDPAALAYVPSPKTYNQMLQLDDVRTLEQYGPQATVLTGELAKYEGAPVVVSEYLREDTSASGKNENAGTNNRGSIVLVNRKRWFVGTRRGVQVLVEKNRTQYDVLDMVSFARKAFEAVLKADGSNYAEEPSGAIVINIGL